MSNFSPTHVTSSKNRGESTVCEIAKILVLSTAHITESTSKWLAAERYPSDEYGFWLAVSSGHIRDRQSSPNELKKILVFAESKECSYVRLDRDGDIVSVFEVFDW